MTISIDQRKVSDGKSKFFLRFYDKSRKWTETLEVFTVDKPQTKAERESNKTAWQLVEAIRGTRLVEYQNGKYGFSDTYKQQGSFLDYFKKLTENRKRSQGNYGNWRSTYQILLKFTDGKGLTFEEVTPEFLECLKNFYLKRRLLKVTPVLHVILRYLTSTR
jgi:hypothetical protein